MRARDPDADSRRTRIGGPWIPAAPSSARCCASTSRAGATAISRRASSKRSRACSSIRGSSIGFEAEPDGLAAGASYRISDLELASRLSFFLWSSIPDDELLAAAAAGGLHEPAALERQVRRMLADPRSRRARRELRRAVAQAARARRCAAARPGFRRAAARLVAARDRAAVRARAARGSQRARAAQLRATRSSTSASRATTASTACAAAISAAWSCREDSPRGGLLGLGQHPDGNLGRQSHVARRARRVDRREPARCRGAAPAAGRRSRLVGCPLARRSEDAPPAHGGAPHGPGLRRVPSAHRPVRLRARELRSRRAAGARATPASGSMPPLCSSTARPSMARPRCAQRCSTAPTLSSRR